ncbi:MAG: filamentous hemagglutinin N-terminal domain-containing protein, partial [Desulfurivibrionaceae bacterium]
MHTKRMNRNLCFWNFSSLTSSWHNRPGRHRRALQSTGCLQLFSRLAPNFPYRRGLLALSLILPATALAGPAGEQVTNGIATVTRPNITTTLITQQTPKAVIDWQNFSIAQPEMVRFQQPGADSIALNRVLGNDPTRIYGNLTANGQVFLVNPNGVLFAPGSQVSVHGLLATTHDINNDDFLAGRYSFGHTENALPDGQVVNQGSLQAFDGGYIVLAGDYTANSGVIQARMGTVALASGNRFTLDLNGDQLIGLAVNKASLAKRAGVENFGTIAADGGQVLMTARVAGELAGTVVNNAGLVQAQSIGEQNGEIILYGGTAGIVTNNGTLDASGKNANETGGSVQILGKKVGLMGQTIVDVSGKNGGGTALIGGDYQGRPMQLPLPFTGESRGEGLPNAQATYLGKDTVINADATGNGDGGKVIVWANETVAVNGTISARGGLQSGGGGFVETSGAHVTIADSTRVNTTAPQGKAGGWLIDPDEYIIATGGDISGATLGTNLDSTPVTILSTNGTLGGTTGNIYVNEAVSWTASNLLTLNATNSIIINANITSTPAAAPSGSVTMTAGNAILFGGNITLTNNGSPSGTLTLTAGNGGIAETTGTITAGALRATSIGSVSFPNANSVTTIAASLTGAGSSFGYEGANGFSIGNVGGMLGVQTNNGNITVRGNGANAIQIAENVTAGTGTVLIGQAVSSGGDIDVAATKSVSGNNVQLYTADTGGNLTVNGSVTGISTVDLNIPGILTVINGGAISGPVLTLSADNMDLQAGSSINAGAGIAWLRPYTANYDIDLGLGTTLGDLGLTTNELNTITTTGVLRIGALTAGNLAITAAIAPANVSTLSLESGGTITQAGAGTITETNLAIKALGDVTLDTAANLATSLAATIGDGTHQNRNFKFKNSPALNISANIDGRIGISTAIDANNFDSASPNGVIALTSGASLTQSAGALLAGKAVYAEGGRVVLPEANPTGVIAGKATGFSAGDIFSYKSSNGIQITTVDSFSGIQSASLEPAGVLLAAGNNGVSQDATAPITASSGLMLNTTGPIDLDNAANSVAALAANGVTNLYFNETTALTLGITGNGISTSANGPININTGGLLTVQDPVNAGSGALGLEAPNIQLGAAAAAGTSIGGGLIKLRASQAAGSISSAAGATSATTINGTDIAMEADNFTYPSSAPALTATHAITYTTATDNGNISISGLGSATNTAPWLVIGNDTATDTNTTGNIAVDAAITGTGVVLLAGGGISQTAAITANALAAKAGSVTSASTIDLNTPNTVTNFAAQTRDGAISITNAAALAIGNITDGTHSASGIVSTNGNVTIKTSTGNINLSNPINTGSGAVTLDTDAGAVTGTAVISGSQLTVDATTGIGTSATPLSTSVSLLTANNTGTSGDINILNYGTLTTTGWSSNGDPSNADGNIKIVAQSPLTIGVDGGVSARNNIWLEAGSTSAGVTTDNLTINGEVISTNAGTITLRAGSSIFENFLISTTGTVVRQPC